MQTSARLQEYVSWTPELLDALLVTRSEAAALLHVQHDLQQLQPAHRGLAGLPQLAGYLVIVEQFAPYELQLQLVAAPSSGGHQ